MAKLADAFRCVRAGFAGAVAVVAVTTSTIVLGGCSRIGVEPWERDVLAQEAMQTTSLESSIDDHIYFSKEASSGGRAHGGGGCGCN
jgi:hypothetical protein